MTGERTTTLDKSRAHLIFPLYTCWLLLWFSFMQNRASTCHQSGKGMQISLMFKAKQGRGLCTLDQSGKGMPRGIGLRPIRGGELFGACLSCQRFSDQSLASSFTAFFSLSHPLTSSAPWGGYYNYIHFPSCSIFFLAMILYTPRAQHMAALGTR